MPVFLWIFFVISVAAGVSIALGLRGRRLDDHPWCRKCRYDLVAAEPGTDRCPECGCDLTLRRAVRIGRRARRPALLVAGALLVAVAIGGSAFVGWQQSRGLDINRYKPVWMLLRDGGSAGATRADTALAELLRRFGDGRLTTDEIETVVTSALDVQADPSAPWRAGWGDLVDSAAAAGLLLPDERESYALHAVDLDWFHRPRVRRGDPLPLAYQFARRRVGAKTQFNAMVSLENVRVGPRELSYRTIWGGAGYGLSGWHLYDGRCEVLGSSDARSSSSGIDHEILVLPEDRSDGTWPAVVDLEPGTYELSATWRVAITPAGDDEPAAEIVREGAVSVEVLPADARIVTIEPAGAAETAPTASAERTTLQIRSDAAFVGGILKFSPPARDAAFDIFWRSGEDELLMGGCAIRATASPSQVFYRRRISDAATRSRLEQMGDRVDIVLRPSAAAARLTTDLVTIPDLEIVIDAVEVEIKRPE